MVLTFNTQRIILVGGFGESPYLFRAMQNWCKAHGEIVLMCPNQPQSAVVRGAALRGLEGIAPRMKRARRHYGFGINMNFREGIDPERLAYMDTFDPDRKLCSDRIWWVIAKGEKVYPDTVRTHGVEKNYTPGQPVSSTVGLYSCGLNDAPEYNFDPGVQQVGSVRSDYAKDFDFGPKVKSTYSEKLGRIVYKFPYQVQVKFGNKGDNLQFVNIVNGEQISQATIEFDKH